MTSGRNIRDSTPGSEYAANIRMIRKFGGNCTRVSWQEQKNPGLLPHQIKPICYAVERINENRSRYSKEL